MLSKFEKRVADYISANGLFRPGDRLLLAVSGGADSTALMHAMHRLKHAGIFHGDLVCAHINHRLREADSDTDEEFAVSTAKKLDITIAVEKIDVRKTARLKKLSIETAARELRIEKLQHLAEVNNCSCVVTAHHKDDNAETVLQRLIRGTGFRGLAGIWPKRELGSVRFVRPLLGVGRREIVEYLQKNNLLWRQDMTNYDCAYRRNFIRHRLIPYLQKQFKWDIVEGLSKLAQASRNLQMMVSRDAERMWSCVADCTDGRSVLSVDKLLAQSELIKVELVRKALISIECGEADLIDEHYRRILKLARQKDGGRHIELPGDFAVRREYGKLIFERRNRLAIRHLERGAGEAIEIAVPGRTGFDDYTIDSQVFDVGSIDMEGFKIEKTAFVERFDIDKLRFPLHVRFRRQGERFMPLGQRADKRISQFLTDQKVPDGVRNTALVVADGEKIIWLWPVRMCEQAKVTDKTGKILQIGISHTRTKQTRIQGVNS